MSFQNSTLKNWVLFFTSAHPFLTYGPEAGNSRASQYVLWTQNENEEIKEVSFLVNGQCQDCDLVLYVDEKLYFHIYHMQYMLMLHSTFPPAQTSCPLSIVDWERERESN